MKDIRRSARTPAWIDSLIDCLAPDRMAEEIRGDLCEMFVNDLGKKSLASSRRRYIVNGLGFLFKRFFWKSDSPSNANVMLKSYFKMARRSLLAYKGTAFINILGLVAGIASALVILTVIRFELSFDDFHTHRDRTYRMVRVSGEDMSEFRTGISYPVPDAVEEGVPTLENITSLEYFGAANVDVLDPAGKSERKFREESGVVIVEPSFFEVFDFKDTGFRWIEGSPEKALAEPFNVVLTRSMAKKYFGEKNPVGESLRFQQRYDCKITGVVEDFPPNTDFPFTTLVSYSTLRELAGDERLNDWSSVNDSHHTYVVLAPGTNPQDIEEQIAEVHAAHTPQELHQFRHYLLQKLSDVHFDPKFGTLTGRTITKETILGLGIVALFLLLTGSINYINLATAQSTLRAKEIGLRKVMGSNRSNLMWQFLIETFIIVFIAGIVALVLSEVILYRLQSLLNLRMTDYNFTDPHVMLYLLVIILFVTMFSGFYPSLMISRFNPVNTLKNTFSTERIRGVSLRKVLVVVQFTITQMLVVGTFIVVSQMHYFQTANMGFNQDAIITARIPGQQPSVLQTMEDKLRSQAFVEDLSFSYTLPSGINRNRSYMDIGKPSASSMQDYAIYEYVAIDDSFLDLYGIKLVAGRNLTPQDSSGHILINKTLVRDLQLGSPEEAVGKELKTPGGDRFTIAGVVDDYYSNSLKSGVDDIVMFMKPENYAAISIKLGSTGSGSTLQEAIKGVEKIWSETFPEYVFSYSFLDENIKAFYRQEKKYAQLFQLFSMLFLVIGCLGLYGLITFVVNRKGKEIAIRKVLGATVSQILILFSGEYVRLIILSFLLAVPVAWFVVRDWLSNFSNHIQLEWWFFALPGLAVLLITLVVVAIKSMKTAFANPVDKLKYE